MPNLSKFDKFFWCIGRYMQNENMNVTFKKDGSIVLQDLSTGEKEIFSHSNALNKLCEVME